MNTFHIPLDQKMPIKHEKIESRLTQLFCVFPLVVPSENSNKNTILHKFDLIRHNAIFLKSKLVKNVRNYVQYMSSIHKMCCARMQLQFSCIILNSKKKNMPGVSRGNMNNAPPIDIYLFKVNDENSTRMYEIFSKFKVKTLTSFWCIYF